METVKEKQQTAFKALKEHYGYRNQMQTPRIVKVVVSVGVGKQNKDKHRMEMIADRLARLTGQKAAPRGAKQSIASFKLREGDLSGFQVTLRGNRMYNFLDKLIAIDIPRTRDFHGISPNAFDVMGNYTLGIKEHTIFPETSDEELKDVFGLAVTVVTSAKKVEEARAFLTHIGFPFKKEKPS